MPTATRVAPGIVLRPDAVSRGALFNTLSGDAAQKAVFPAIQANAWNLHAAGKTRVVYRTEITGPAAAQVGPQLGPEITADFPDVLAALVHLAES